MMPVLPLIPNGQAPGNQDLAVGLGEGAGMTPVEAVGILRQTREIHRLISDISDEQIEALPESVRGLMNEFLAASAARFELAKSQEVPCA